MGQQNSKSTAEDRSILHHVDGEDECQRKDASSSQDSVFQMQKKVDSLQSSSRRRERSAGYPWPQSRCDAGGLVYVMDNPTGGVWVKPEQKWTRCWRLWRHRPFYGSNSSHPAMGNADEPPMMSRLGTNGRWCLEFPNCSNRWTVLSHRHGRQCNCLLHFIDLAYMNF